MNTDTINKSKQYFEKQEAIRYANRYKGRSFNFFEYIYLNYRLNKIKENFNHFNPEVIADLGCGTGELLENILERESKIKLASGIDYSMSMLILAKDKLNTVDLVRADITNLPYKDESFDLLFSIGVIPYLENPKEALSEILRVLRKGGACFLSYPYKRTILTFFRTNPIGLWIRKNIFKIAIYEVKFEKDDFFNLLNSTGFQIQKEIRLLLSEYLLILKK